MILPAKTIQIKQLNPKLWDPFFLKVIKHWYVCKVGDGLGTSIDYVRGLRSRAERSEARREPRAARRATFSLDELNLCPRIVVL